MTINKSNQPEYIILKQQEKQDQNSQQLYSQVILPSTTTGTSHQHQIPNLPCRNNLVGQKMTPWKLSSSLLSTQANHHNTFW
jgi:hypothetical protein